MSTLIKICHDCEREILTDGQPGRKASEITFKTGEWPHTAIRCTPCDAVAAMKRENRFTAARMFMESGDTASLQRVWPFDEQRKAVAV